jgi:hypothetical protein
MKKEVISLAVILLLVHFYSFCQTGMVSVDRPSGGVRVSIPLYTVSAGGVSLPIALSYATAGIRPTDMEGSAGMGWELIAGGAVTRQLRGLPDDVVGDMAGVMKTGWISSTNGDTINSLTIHNTTNPPSYLNVQPDVSFIQNNFTLTDTEPDIFSVSAPGLSVQFVFDKDHKIRTIPYQDVKISYTSSSAGITGFTVTNDRGVTYVFAAAETTVRKSVAVSPAPVWFYTDYWQFINGITYQSAWRLTQVHDLYNNSININYTAGGSVPSSSKIQVYLNGSATPTTLYTIWQKTVPELISSITYQEGNGTGSPVTAFSFSFANNSYTNANIINSITGFGRSFQFNYTLNVHSGDNYTRYFLTNVTDADCNTPVNYTFAYNNLSNLPDSATTREDYWGYINNNTDVASLEPVIQINPSTSGYDRYRNFLSDDGAISAYPYKINTGSARNVNPTYITVGALNQVSYASGGYTTISYEPNDFYDPVSTTVEQGAGIRVNQLAHYDGINASPSTVSYAYLDPGTGWSSGKPLSLPIYAFTQAYTSTEADSIKWRKSTVISWSDLSTDDHSIVYNYVRESRAGAGSTLYQFSVPVTNFDSSTPTGAPAWAPTMVYSGSSTTNAIGFLNNTTRTYPFPPGTNYDFERGLPLDVTNYDNNNNKVSETAYTYTTPQTPVVITAYKYDMNTSAEESYGKYYINTTAGPLTTQVVSKLFSLTVPSSYLQTTATFAYNGALHKQLTQETTTNSSDGTVINKYIKYVKDYVVSTAGDNMTQALLNLQAANVNAPIEEYTQVTPSGLSAGTVSASLVNYKVFTPSGYSLTLPSARMAVAARGGTAFTPSSISTASPNTFVYDNAHYTTVENDLAYDYSGYLLSRDNGFKHISTGLTDHTTFQPAAVIDNARYDEVAFSDFDSKLPGINFTGTTTLTSNSRSGQYANALSAGMPLTKTVNRNMLAANYIVSAWIQCSGTAGTLSATITGGSTSGSGSASYAVTTGNPTLYPTGWQYVEFKIPLTGIASSTVAITISCNTAVIIDDVWAYPDVAEVSAYAYDPVAFFKTAATNTNGVASYYSYDKFGRLLYAYDQDKNIVQRKIYASAANETNFTAPAITGAATAFNGVSASWGMGTPVYNSCITASGVTYTWNFGDNTTPLTTSSYYPVSHAYAANGSYTITLTASSPAYGSKASTLAVTVSTLTQTAISYNNYTTGSSITSVVFAQHSTGTTMYNLTAAQLTAGYTITPDTYDITVYVTGPQYSSSTGQGYKSVALSAGSDISDCLLYTGSALTASGVNLAHEPSANFSMYTGICP